MASRDELQTNSASILTFTHFPLRQSIQVWIRSITPVKSLLDINIFNATCYLFTLSSIKSSESQNKQKVKNYVFTRTHSYSSKSYWHIMHTRAPWWHICKCANASCVCIIHVRTWPFRLHSAPFAFYDDIRRDGRFRNDRYFATSRNILLFYFL